MKILISGGCGYIGSVLTNYLSNDKLLYGDITVVDKLIYNQGLLIQHALKYVKFECVDITDYLYNNKERLKNFDVIIHLAAIVGAPACEKNPFESHRINKTSTQHLVDYLNKSTKHPHLIFYNTNSGYGKGGAEACTEETPLNAISVYGKDKNVAEQYIVSNYDNYTIFRLATVFGPSFRTRIDLLVNTLVYEALFNKTIAMFDGNFRRNFIHIQDVISATYWSIINHNKSKNQIFNLGNDEWNMTKRQLINIVQEKLHCEVYTKGDTDPDQRDYLVSNKKLTDAGFLAHLSLDTGINGLLDYYYLLPLNKDERNKQVQMLKNI